MLKTYIPKSLEKLELDKFLDTYDLPKSNQDSVDNFSISKAVNEIEAAIKNKN